MKKCFAPSAFIKSPPFSDEQRRRMLGLFGEMAEGVIGTDYLRNEVKHDAWYPAPPALDFHDANKGFASRTQYLSFILNHNPGVDEKELTRIVERAIKGPDGQLLCIPDFMSQGAPQQERFYEVKPDSADGTSEADKKMAFIDGYMHSLGLPYRPGVSWKPDKQYRFFTGVVFFTLVTVSFHYERHKTIQGVIVYHFCIETKSLLPLALLLFILALIVIKILFPEIPFPDPPKLPIPAPVPIPIPKPPVPVPAIYGVCGEALEGSVGQGGDNKRGDVQVVQLLLNGWMEASKKTALAIDGVVGPKTIAAITSFQREYTPAYVTGCIEPGSPSLFHLGEMTLSQLQRKVITPSVVLEKTYHPVAMSGLDMRVLLWKLLEEAR